MNRVNLHLKMITSLSELIVENIIYKRSKRDVCCAASSVLASKLARSAPVGQCRAPPEPSCNDNKKISITFLSMPEYLVEISGSRGIRK